ncbi:right-handed parallel beta-helix repeat-containing protein [Anaerovorax odorimutans]|uniref:Right-handed parallel beta-helix repeat-containing protein n=1 Tax=Anaerovorax odorimutans TaxID=109327 RepID=A0ABT1RJE8_9FIRM|nr:right-handed parallel beta-helix repeat-containing protein [Anaerovorax odorimutans]MCQ4635293.1 right-handed parallel beta-helix repeat-containing protein [Anaerovorax odorimutans]
MKKSFKRLLVIMSITVIGFTFTVPAAAFADSASGSVTVTTAGELYAAMDDSSVTNITIPGGTTINLTRAIRVKSNKTINAAGATIVRNGTVMLNEPAAVDYKAFSNLTILGGIWKSTSSKGYNGTMIRLAHGNNITFDGCTVYTNYSGHGIELIACKNVNVRNCTLLGQGTCPKKGLEEQLQIDIATPKTAPGLKQYGSKYVNGQTCQNVYVTNCTITGARAVCANYASKEKKFKKKFHKNIQVKNCTLTGKTSEALALFNTRSAVVSGNKIYSKGKRTSSSYTVGCHVAMFGKAPSGIKKDKITITNNTIKGGRHAVLVYSHSSSKYGKVTVKKNKLYCKKGKKNALKISGAKKKSVSKNKLKKW